MSASRRELLSPFDWSMDNVKTATAKQPLDFEEDEDTSEAENKPVESPVKTSIPTSTTSTESFLSKNRGMIIAGTVLFAASMYLLYETKPVFIMDDSGENISYSAIVGTSIGITLGVLGISTFFKTAR